MDDFTQLKKIATESLRACYVDDKMVASPTHFSDFWARDTFWAIPGMCAIGDTARAKKCLEYFLSLQRSDGKIPRKVSRDINVVKYLFGVTIKRQTPRPTYHGLVRPFYAMDSELLLIIAAAAYIDATDDDAFAQKYYDHLARALAWHTQRTQDHLVRGYFLSNWMDTVFKFGPVLYTNVLFVKATQSLAHIAQKIERTDDAQKISADAVRVHDAVQKAFWSLEQEFFIDEARLPQRHAFDLAGNTLAVLWDIASPEQSQKIMQKIDTWYARDGVFMGAVPSGQKWWKINPVVGLMGIANYHTTTSWSWIDALVAEAFARHGYAQQTQEMYATLEATALRDNEIGETYFTDSTPYKKLLWRSASPFAWGSGVILATLARLDK